MMVLTCHLPDEHLATGGSLPRHTGGRAESIARGRFVRRTRPHRHLLRAD